MTAFSWLYGLAAVIDCDDCRVCYQATANADLSDDEAREVSAEVHRRMICQGPKAAAARLALQVEWRRDHGFG